MQERENDLVTTTAMITTDTADWGCPLCQKLYQAVCRHAPILTLTTILGGRGFYHSH